MSLVTNATLKEVRIAGSNFSEKVETIENVVNIRCKPSKVSNQRRKEKARPESQSFVGLIIDI